MKKKNPCCDFILAEKADVGARVKISLKVVTFPHLMVAHLVPHNTDFKNTEP